MVENQEKSFRLDKAIELYYKELERGNHPIIFVPGSRHKDTKKVDREEITIIDKISLSQAGTTYLISKGIPKEDIRGEIVYDKDEKNKQEDPNKKYKGKDGVYNSGDECYVANEIANAEGCERIISIVSPMQISRKALFYIHYGKKPEMYGVGSNESYHNYIGEALWSLLYTFFIDPTWQDEKKQIIKGTKKGILKFRNPMGALTRKGRDNNYYEDRKPGFKERIEKIIKALQNKMGKYSELKKIYEDKFKEAKEKMEQRKGQNGVCIGIELTDTESEEGFEEKLDQLSKLYKNSMDENKKTTIYIIGGNEEKIKALKSRLKDNQPIHIEEGSSYTNLVNYVKEDETIESWYNITDSQIVMNEGVIAIKEGITPPIMFSVSNPNSSYVDPIANLYSKILKFKTILAVGKAKIAFPER